MSDKNIVYYVRQDNRKYEKLSERVRKFLRKFIGKVKSEKIENGRIILVPRYKKYNKIISKIFVRKIKSYAKNNENSYFVFEENLKFMEKNFKVENRLDGKYFMKNSLLKIMEYIFKINKRNMNLENVYIFVNNYTKNNIYIIKRLISQFKTVNIITENLKYYRRLECSLFEQGILITVSNNRRKSARNAEYVINIDFKKENFEKYNINKNSTIINISEDEISLGKLFNGVIINNFEVEISNDSEEFVNEFFGNINKKIYLESRLINGNEYLEKSEKLYELYDAKINELIGVRGKLQKDEFLR